MQQLHWAYKMGTVVKVHNIEERCLRPPWCYIDVSWSFNDEVQCNFNLLTTVSTHNSNGSIQTIWEMTYLRHNHETNPGKYNIDTSLICMNIVHDKHDVLSIYPK